MQSLPALRASFQSSFRVERRYLQHPIFLSLLLPHRRLASNVSSNPTSAATSTSTSTSSSTSASERITSPKPPSDDDEKRSWRAEFEDFRPPWVYTAERVLQYTLIPTALFYMVFYMDWGDHEHVFSPARRWMERKKRDFFTLSQEEQRIVEEEMKKSVGGAKS